MYETNEISKNKCHYGKLKHQLGIDHLKFCICYISEFYYDAQLGANVITIEPLLSGNE